MSRGRIRVRRSEHYDGEVIRTNHINTRLCSGFVLRRKWNATVVTVIITQTCCEKRLWEAETLISEYDTSSC